MLSRSSLAAAALLAFAATASAQFVPLYSFTQTAGAYTPITGGTLISTATAANTLDDNTFAVTLPFAINFNGAAQTTVQVQTNGHIAFGATSPGTTYGPLSSTNVTPGYVAAFAGDLQGGYGTAAAQTSGSNTITVVSAGPISIGDTITGTGIPAATTVTAVAGNVVTLSANATTTAAANAVTCFGPWSELRWETVGTSPNQEVVIQWSNFRPFGTTVSQNLNFQIRLHENGDIRCVYGNCSPGTSTSTTVRQVGLRGATNVFATDLNNRLNVKGTSDWATSTAGTTNASGQVFNNAAPANVIPSGLTYQWAYPVGYVLASNTTLGNGCGGTFNSFYERFADAAVASAALQGNSLQLINTGTGYVGTWLPGTAASLFVTPVAATVLATGDDGEVNVTPSVPLSTPYGPQATLRVSGNGIVGFGSVALTFPTTTSYTPTAGGFLNSNLGGFYAWHDFASQEAGSGPVASEEIGGILYITYNGVENYPGAPTVNPSTLQFQLNLATGDCTICWVNVDTNTTSQFGSGHLVGVTAPGASLDGGSKNLATSTTMLTTNVPEVLNLSLTALNRPVQGVGPQNWNLDANNLPVGIGVDIIGFADPGITNLNLFGLGQPDCQLRANLDFTSAFISGGLHSYSFAIPGGAPSLNGVELFMQTAALDFAINLATTVTTNGIKGTIGNL